MARGPSRDRRPVRLKGLLGLALSISIPQTLPAAETVVLDLRGYAQEAEAWCWAASSQAVMEFLSPQLKGRVCQCRQAEARSPGLKCCLSEDSCVPASPLDSLCRAPGWPRLETYGFEFRTTCDPLPEAAWDECAGEPLTWQALVSEVSAGRPVLTAHRPRNPRLDPLGHTTVVLGTATTSEYPKEQHWVLVFDPKRVCRDSCERADPPCCQGDASWIPYGEYRAPEGYSHWIDLYGIKINPPKGSASRSDHPSPK
jgi:hypothetical protein